MNPHETGRPLTLDEAGRLVAFLAEHGHHDLAFEVLHGIVGQMARVAFDEMVRTA